MTKTIICKDVFGNQYTVPVDELNIRVGRRIRSYH